MTKQGEKFPFPKILDKQIVIGSIQRIAFWKYFLKIFSFHCTSILRSIARWQMQFLELSHDKIVIVMIFMGMSRILVLVMLLLCRKYLLWVLGSSEAARSLYCSHCPLHPLNFSLRYLQLQCLSPQPNFTHDKL